MVNRFIYTKIQMIKIISEEEKESRINKGLEPDIPIGIRKAKLDIEDISMFYESTMNGEKAVTIISKNGDESTILDSFERIDQLQNEYHEGVNQKTLLTNRVPFIK